MSSELVNQGCDAEKMGAAEVKFGKHVQKGSKVAVIATVREIMSQHGSVSLHLSIEDQGGNIVIIAPHLCERIG